MRIDSERLRKEREKQDIDQKKQLNSAAGELERMRASWSNGARELQNAQRQLQHERQRVKQMQSEMAVLQGKMYEMLAIAEEDDSKLQDGAKPVHLSNESSENVISVEETKKSTDHTAAVDRESTERLMAQLEARTKERSDLFLSFLF